MVSWSYNHYHTHQWCMLWGVFGNVPNSRAVVTLLEAVGYCWFWWYFITKVWSIDHIIIIIHINGVCYGGSSEMCQIWVQWWHFWRLLVTVGFDDSFNTKVWLFHHIIIVIYINGVCYRGSSEMCQIHTQWSHFWRLLVTVDFDDVSLQKYGQLII